MLIYVNMFRLSYKRLYLFLKCFVIRIWQIEHPTINYSVELQLLYLCKNRRLKGTLTRRCYGRQLNGEQATGFNPHKPVHLLDQTHKTKNERRLKILAIALSEAGHPQLGDSKKWTLGRVLYPTSRPITKPPVRLLGPNQKRRLIAPTWPGRQKNFTVPSLPGHSFLFLIL